MLKNKMKFINLLTFATAVYCKGRSIRVTSFRSRHGLFRVTPRWNAKFPIEILEKIYNCTVLCAAFVSFPAMLNLRIAVLETMI
jgi:hypothetical protein